MSQSVKTTAGHVPVPMLIFGSVSILLGLFAEMTGVFEGATKALRGVWLEAELVFETEMGLPGFVGFLVTAVACFGLVGAILATPGYGRRMVLGFSTLCLSLGMVPVLAVWGIFWKPFGVTLAVAWSWFSAMIYSSTHRMPCEEAAKLPNNPTRMAENEEMTWREQEKTDGND